MKIFHKLCKISTFFVVLMFVSSCNSSIESKFTIKNYEVNNANVILTETGESSGEFVSPNNVELSYTVSSISNSKIGKYTYLENSDEVIKILVVPIHFKDSTFSNAKLDEYKTKFDLVFNSTNDSSVAFKSVKEFYYESSLGQVNLEFDVLDFYNANVSSSLYTNEESTKDLIDDALDYFNIDRKEYDLNNDGFIDGIFAIYDVNNVNNNTTSDNDNLWAYTYHSTGDEASMSNPNINAFAWASYDFLLEGYNGKKLDPHTYIHEVGHLFGLYDYYDYNSKSSPLSGLDTMDSNIMDHNLYSKMILGWIKPYVVYGNATININEVKKNNSCVVILSDSKELVYSKDESTFYFNPFSEYILVEPFTYDESSLVYYDLSNGYDSLDLKPNALINTSGYRIYHVDKRLGLISQSSNSYNFSLYDSNIPNYELNGKFFTLILNTTNAESSRLGSLGLSSMMKKYGISDYFNEINLIAKSTKYTNDYKNLYVYQSEDGEICLMPVSNSYLFNKGDTFNPSNYQNYFVNGGNENNCIFNNQNIFSTNIIFE